MKRKILLGLATAMCVAGLSTAQAADTPTVWLDGEQKQCGQRHGPLHLGRPHFGAAAAAIPAAGVPLYCILCLLYILYILFMFHCMLLSQHL